VRKVAEALACRGQPNEKRDRPAIAGACLWGKGDRAARLAQTIQIVAKHSRDPGRAGDSYWGESRRPAFVAPTTAFVGKEAPRL
jgi:hypothetical protein